MLEKPHIQDAAIKSSLQSQYGLLAVKLEHLPLGADKNTAVYCMLAEDERGLYLKLRLGDFNKATVIVPKLLRDNGVKQVIAPIPTNNQQLWANEGSYNLTLYPYIEGKNGFETELTDNQWIALGAVLKELHTFRAPQALKEGIPQEEFSAESREIVKGFLDRIGKDVFKEPTAAKLADFMKSHKAVIEEITQKAEELAKLLRGQKLDFVLCHSDVHAGNVLIDVTGKMYVVDWDTLQFAPKERDLMFIGGGIGGVWDKPEEAALFYQGYGPTDINPKALLYYRCERIVADIADVCKQIFLTDEGGKNRDALLEGFVNQFLPNNVVEIAMRDY